MDMIDAMQTMKALCKAQRSCVDCPMFVNCDTDKINRYPSAWVIPTRKEKNDDEERN